MGRDEHGRGTKPTISQMSTCSPADTSKAFAAAINAGDVPAALELWAEDPLLLHADGQTIAGRQAIESTLEYLVSIGTRLDIQVSRTFETGMAAVGVGTLTMTATTPENRKFEQESQFLVVYTRTSDGPWRLTIDAPWGFPKD
jgi:uncharacterized protein (TIGR02246 family)